MIYTNDFTSCASFLDSSVELGNTHVDISTDTRSLRREQFFLAITGEKFNALNFLENVSNIGCKNIIYTTSKENEKLIEPYREKFNFYKTKDSVSFLQEITNILSNKFQSRGGKLIAISGSNGKTTTKEMLYHLLHSVHPETICTQKNNNNHIGVPLTLLQITEKTKYAIIELGSNHPGEIKALCDICNPAIGITTNIGKTHLEFFENEDNVFKEEGYLYKAVKNCGYPQKVFFQNMDDKFLSTLESADYVHKYGFSGDNFIFSIEKESAIVQNNKYEFKFDNKFITGEHNFYNLCVAFSIAQKIDETNSKHYLEACHSFKPTKNRSEWLEYQNSRVFLDAYNANPDSMLRAIEGFVTYVDKKDYCLVIGDMNELGDNSKKYHTSLAKELKEKGYNNFYFIGRFAEDYNAGCDNIGMTFSSVDKFKKLFHDTVLKEYKYVFIKGSRSLQLESLMDIT